MESRDLETLRFLGDARFGSRQDFGAAKILGEPAIFPAKILEPSSGAAKIWEPPRFCWETPRFWRKIWEPPSGLAIQPPLETPDSQEWWSRRRFGEPPRFREPPRRSGRRPYLGAHIWENDLGRRTDGSQDLGDAKILERRDSGDAKRRRQILGAAKIWGAAEIREPQDLEPPRREPSRFWEPQDFGCEDYLMIGPTFGLKYRMW